MERRHPTGGAKIKIFRTRRVIRARDPLSVIPICFWFPDFLFVLLLEGTAPLAAFTAALRSTATVIIEATSTRLSRKC